MTTASPRGKQLYRLPVFDDSHYAARNIYRRCTVAGDNPFDYGLSTAQTGLLTTLLRFWRLH